MDLSKFCACSRQHRSLVGTRLFHTLHLDDLHIGNLVVDMTQHYSCKISKCNACSSAPPHIITCTPTCRNCSWILSPRKKERPVWSTMRSYPLHRTRFGQYQVLDVEVPDARRMVSCSCMHTLAMRPASVILVG